MTREQRAYESWKALAPAGAMAKLTPFAIPR